MSCDVGKATESRALLILQPSVTSPMPQLILQLLRRFTYITAHSPTLPLLHLRHSSFSNPSFASTTSQVLHLIHLAELIFQPFHHFTYVTTHSTTLPSLYLRHSSFSNPSFASTTSQVPHSLHLVSRPCYSPIKTFTKCSCLHDIISI